MTIWGIAAGWLVIGILLALAAQWSWKKSLVEFHDYTKEEWPGKQTRPYDYTWRVRRYWHSILLFPNSFLLFWRSKEKDSKEMLKVKRCVICYLAVGVGHDDPVPPVADLGAWSVVLGWPFMFVHNLGIFVLAMLMIDNVE